MISLIGSTLAPLPASAKTGEIQKGFQHSSMKPDARPRTRTPTRSSTPTRTATPTRSSTSTWTTRPSVTMTPTHTITRTKTASFTPTSSSTATPSATATITTTPLPTYTPTNTATLALLPAPYFQPYVSYPLGEGQAVAVGDFNTDGLPDIAFTTTGTLWILLQKSDGTLADPVGYAASGWENSIAAGDLNADGRTDIVTVDINMDTISVYLQQLDGTLAAGTAYPAGDGPDAAALGDFNHDGLLDVAVAIWREAAIGVFYQNAAGSLDAMVRVSAPKAGYDDIAAGDVNGDGLDDIVKMNGQGLTPNLSVFLQQTDGTLAPAASYSVPDCTILCWGRGIDIGDVTGDLREDIVMSFGGNRPTSKIIVFPQTSEGSLGTPVSYDVYDLPEPVHIADINQDGRLDVITSHVAFSRVGLLMQQSNGTLQAEVLYSTPIGDYVQPPVDGISSGDLNMDGMQDILIADSDYGLEILYQSLTPTPAPTFTRSSTPSRTVTRTPTSSRTWTPSATQTATPTITSTLITPTDTDTPTITSTLITPTGTDTPSATFTIFPATETDTPTITPTEIIPTDTDTPTLPPPPTPLPPYLFGNYINYPVGQGISAGVGDFNADGRQDAAMTIPGALLIFLQTGEGALADPVSYPASQEPNSLAVGDLNGDGYQDIAVADHDASSISIYLQSDHILLPPVTYPAGINPLSIAVGDVNGDGYADVVVDNSGEYTFGVFTQNPTGGLNPMVTYFTPMSAYNDLAIGDVNSDGLLDVVKMNAEIHPFLMIYLQQEDGTLLDEPVTYDMNCTCFAFGVTVGDVTQDGRGDVIVGVGENPPDSVIAIFVQGADGRLDTLQLLPANALVLAPRLEDIDYDGRLDILSLNYGTSSNLGVQLQQSDGSFIEQPFWYTFIPFWSPNTRALALGDVNGDGLSDAVISDGSSGLIVLPHLALIVSPTPIIPTPTNTSTPTMSSTFTSTPTPTRSPSSTFPPTLTVTPSPTPPPVFNVRGEWEFENNLEDSSGYGNNGTDNPPLSAQYNTGAYSLSLVRSGTDLPIQIQNNNASLTILDQITLEAWIYSTDYGSGYRHIIDSFNSFALSIKDGRLAAMLHGPGDWWEPDITALAVNQWHYVAATYDGYAETLYIDGYAVASRAGSGAIPSGTGQIAIGGVGSGENAYLFQGRLDSVRVTRGALGAPEIFQIYMDHIIAYPTLVLTETFTPTQTPTRSNTPTRTVSRTATTSRTITSTWTVSRTPSMTRTITSTWTASVSPSITRTRTATATPTRTWTPSKTITPTRTPFDTGTPTSTPTPSLTEPLETPTDTPTPVPPVTGAFTAIYPGLPNVNNGSVEWGDYDGDGDLDILLVGCLTGSCSETIAAVYRNDIGAFSDIQAGLQSVGQGAADWGDYDADGDLDILLEGCAIPGCSSFVTKVYRNDGGIFTDIQADLLGVAGADQALAWVDYDQDGDLDILITGDYPGANGHAATRLYRNDGGTFVDTGAALPQVNGASVDWGDYNGDGFPDLVISGELDSLERVTRVYRNDNGILTDINAGLTGAAYGAVHWGDFDQDGDLDILQTGQLGYPTLERITKIYRNDGGVFTDINALLPGVTLGSVDWADFDNDGSLDFVLTGYTGTMYIARVYDNLGGFFEDTGFVLSGVSWASAAWGDYDLDGRMDILIAGWTGSAPYTQLYHNELQIQIPPPAGPTPTPTICFECSG